MQQPRLDRLLGADVAALAHARALADAIAQVVELRAPHVAAGGHLDPLDLRRVHRERALDADAEGLLAHRERLARAVALALDHDALEDLHAAAGPLDHLEVDLQAIAGREVGNAAQLRALDGFDDGAHEVKKVRRETGVSLKQVSGRRGSNRSGRQRAPRHCRQLRGCRTLLARRPLAAFAAALAPPRLIARGGRRAAPPARASRGTRPGACSAGTRDRPRARR